MKKLEKDLITNGQHWSIDSRGHLKGLIDDFKKRLYGS